MNKKILIIDDDESLQKAWRRLLLQEAPSLECIQAFSIKEAEMILDNNLDLSIIAIDACVPGDEVNTLDLVRKICENVNHCPIIAISNLFNDILIKAGCNHETSKGKLVKKIKEVLNI